MVFTVPEAVGDEDVGGDIWSDEAVLELLRRHVYPRGARILGSGVVAVRGT